MRVLITGVNGFIGPWLATHILAIEPKTHIWGMAWGSACRRRLEPLAPRLEIVDGDVTEPASLKPVLDASRPDLVFHLAGASSVATSWSSPSQALTVNAIGQINLLEAIRRLALKPRVVIPSSAEVYGPVRDNPTDEDMGLAPLSPYGVSKAAQELIANQYHHSWGIETTCLRLFNLIGPGQHETFAASSFAKQIAEIEEGLRAPVIKVGNLDARRDFTDVRDAVRAFWLTASATEPGTVFNLCRGTAVAIQLILDVLIDLSPQHIEVEVDSNRLRRADTPELWGSPGRLASATGWQPHIPLEETLSDLLVWWRQRAGKKQDGGNRDTSSATM